MTSQVGKISEASLKRMRLPKLYWSASMDQVRPKGSEHELQVKRYLEKLPQMMARGGGLYLWGPNRGGKTALLAIILKAAKRLSASCLYMRAYDVMGYINNDTKFDESTTMLQRAKSVAVLGLDDMGKEHRTKAHAFSERSLENILRTRSEDRLITIVTSNINPRVQEGQKQSQLASIYPESMVRLMMEVLYPVPVHGHDFGKELGAQLRADLEDGDASA